MHDATSKLSENTLIKGKRPKIARNLGFGFTSRVEASNECAKVPVFIETQTTSVAGLGKTGDFFV